MNTTRKPFRQRKFIGFFLRRFGYYKRHYKMLVKLYEKSCNDYADLRTRYYDDNHKWQLRFTDQSFKLRALRNQNKALQKKIEQLEDKLKGF
jgi:hypothetical protein